MSNTSKFRLTPIASSVAIALAVPAAAFAAGMPGAGTVTIGNVAANAGATKGGAVGTTITGLTSGAQLTVTKNSVVQWGGYNPAGAGVAALKADTNPAGFNVGAGNTLLLTGTAANASLLNVDASGNTSLISGTIMQAGTKTVNVFISNANGITVTPTGVISAPVVGLIGADLAAAPDPTTGLPTVTASDAGQIGFGGGAPFNIAFGNNGAITVSGTIVGDNTKTPATNATQVIIAGSNAVNVDYSHVHTAATQVFGGTGLQLRVQDNTAAGFDPAYGKGFIQATLLTGTTKTQAKGYSPANVSLVNATPTQVFANGDLSFDGYSTLPSNTAGVAAKTDPVDNYGWTGVLSNTGHLTLTNTYIAGVLGQNNAGTIAYTGYTNPWYNTASPTGNGFVQTPVGSVDNSGTLNPGGVGLTIWANGITNTGTLNVGTNGLLVLNSDKGDISLGGTVQASKGTAAIGGASLATLTSGNVTVSAPLTIRGDSTGATFAAPTGSFLVGAKGDVKISGTVGTSDTRADSKGVATYGVTGNSITITADQTANNINGTTTKQPTATLNVNQNGQTVTIGDGTTFTAGNVMIGTGVNGSVPSAAGPPAVFGYQNRVNLVADGNITATNTAELAQRAYEDGDVNIYATNVAGSGNGVITGQVIGIQAFNHVRKSQPLLTDDYWSNGLVLKTVGSDPTVNLYADGQGRQFWNLRVDGNATLNSGDTANPRFIGPSLSGTGAAGANNPNILSQVMFMATGNIQLGGTPVPGVVTNGLGMDTRGVSNGLFYWPGLLYLGNIGSLDTPRSIGTGSIASVGPVNNSVATPVSGGQGQYFMTNSLSLSGSIYTNLNSWVNYATEAQVAEYQGVTYAVAFSPNEISNTLNMVPNTGIGHVYDPVLGY
jgi:filamentous hemagglutinin family protein